MVIDEHKLEEFLCIPAHCMHRGRFAPIYRNRNGYHVVCSDRQNSDIQFVCSRIRGPLFEVGLLLKCKIDEKNV